MPSNDLNHASRDRPAGMRGLPGSDFPGERAAAAKIPRLVHSPGLTWDGPFRGANEPAGRDEPPTADWRLEIACALRDRACLAAWEFAFPTTSLACSRMSGRQAGIVEPIVEKPRAVGEGRQ